MKQPKVLTLLLPAVMLVVALAVPAAARGESSTGSSLSQTSDSTASTDKTTPETEQEIENGNKTRGNEITAEMMKGRKSHTDQERKTHCLAAQHGLTTKLANLQNNTKKYQTKIDTVFQRALDYQQANNLNPTGFTDLVNTANTAKANASAAVAALDNLSVNIDCNSSGVASTIATFKAAAQKAHSSLKAYKTAVKNILVALAQTGRGGNQ
jgi:flagellar basal body-associated protein FliL